MFKKAFLFVLCSILVGCSASISDFKDETPKLDFFQFFNGETEAYGMVQDSSGKIISRFTVNTIGVIKDNKLILDETFKWDRKGNNPNKRIWTVRKENGKYIANASDVEGDAIGVESGNAFNLKYTLKVMTDRYGEVNVSVNDWMYLQDPKHIINLTTMTKFGFTVGKISIFFTKKS